MLSHRPRSFPNVLSEGLVRQAEALLSDVQSGSSVFMQSESMRDETWFWREPWRSMEREVDHHVQRGDVESFDTMEEFFASLGE